MPKHPGMDAEKAKRDARRASDAWRARIGAGVRSARERSRLTQGDLAAVIGVDIATVSKTELGKTVPDFATIETMADILGVGIDELVGRVRPPAYGAETGSRLPEGPVAEAIRALQAQVNLLKSELRAARKPGAKSSQNPKGRHTA